MINITNGDTEMENLIINITAGQSDGKSKGFDLAKKIATQHEIESGNKCTIKRILDYADVFDNERREHYSFDVVEHIVES